MRATLKPLLAAGLAVTVGAALTQRLRAEDKKEEFRATPGTGRWDVKIANDAEVKDIPLTGVDTTLEDLLKLPRPEELPVGSKAYLTNRVSDVEKAVWNFEADLTKYRLRDDGDIELVLRGESRKTLLGCMPDPRFLDDKSPWFQRMRLARRTFEARFHPERKFKSSASHVLVSGAGYWSTEPKSEGASASGLEIHPITGIRFLLPTKPDPRPKDKKIKGKDLKR